MARRNFSGSILLITAAFAIASPVRAGSDFDSRAQADLARCVRQGFRAKTLRAVPIESTEPNPRAFAFNEAENALNTRLAERFPRLAFMLRDPDSFINTMRERFAAQKKLTPDRPYQFDYSEIGIPIVRDMRDSIERRITELKEIQTGLKDARQSGSVRKRIKAMFSKFDVRELDTGLAYLNDLAQEADRYLAQGHVSYQDTIEFASFYARAIGHFEHYKATPFARNFLRIDQKLDGYRQLPIDQEYAMYRNRNFSPFQRGEPIAASGFRRPDKTYGNAITDPRELRVILVPTNDALDNDILMRLMSREQISLVGVTHDPILADGFLRPGGDFWNHDMRHESGKFANKVKYVVEHNLSADGEQRLNQLIDTWYYQLESEMEKIPDANLREAVRLLAFNFHHDRGYPLIPSAYLKWKLDNVPYSLYGAMKISGQGVPFPKPFRNYKNADAWLRNFWRAHRGQEVDFLARERGQE